MQDDLLDSRMFLRTRFFRKVHVALTDHAYSIALQLPPNTSIRMIGWT